MPRIGLSYHEGKPEYGLYASLLVEAGERLGIAIEPVWLAGANRSFQPALADDLAGVVLTGGADVGPERYGLTDSKGLCRPIRERDDAELPLVHAVLERQLPVLAICRGMQLLSWSHG
jgi:putative glutamine amidotransferase